MKKSAIATFILAAVLANVTAAGTHLVGGSANQGNGIPFRPMESGMRWQTIWHQTDIAEAGTITKVEFQTQSITEAGTFYNCNILLCHTSLAHVTTAFHSNYSGNTPVTVFVGTKVVPVMPQGQWFPAAESINFEYNNTNNLLIEIHWSGASGETMCSIYSNSRGKAGRVFALDPNANTGTVTENYDTIGRITISPTGVEPTSLGRIKGLYN
ncbi:MAG: hypothetical protein PVH29_07480 [Candidatus Zixiibacteriota bacterium]|jgi:hypothetical protein